MIATFYSFKGGVGRSMAVANVAALLARQGLRVLVVDFDLEAPGLEQYFQIDHRAARRHSGLLDLVLAYKQWMSVSALPGDEPAFRRLDDFILPIYTKLPGNASLDLLPAGRREPKEAMDSYVASLRSFDWQDFYSNWDGELFFEFLRAQLAPPRYDLVIVDSRTGVTEMGGICTFQLADLIVLFTGANHQNRRGTLDVMRDFEALPSTLRGDRPLQMLVVPARVEQRDPALLQAFMEAFEAQFGDRLPARLKAAPLTYQDLLIPYEPAYAFEERVLSDPNRADERRAIAGAFERLAQAVKLLLPAAADAASAPGPAAPAETAYDAAKRFAGYDVFVSCAAADADSLQPLLDRLQQRLNLAVFVDRRELVAGEDWRARTAHALFHSKVCLVCYGPAGLTRSQLDELTTAAEGAIGAHGLPVVPVLLPGASRGAFQASMPLQFARTAPLDLRAGLDSPDSDAALKNICAPETSFAATTGAAATEQPVLVAAAAKCPYPGPRPFTEADGPFFFGRRAAADAIVERLGRQGAIVVVGASGCGKTSTVQGGVVPRLRSKAAASGVTLTVRQLGGGCSRADIDAAVAALEQAAGVCVCVVDSLERFTRGRSPADATSVLNRLDEVARAGRVRVIMICRDARLNEVRALAPAGLLEGDHVVRLEPLDQDQLREIIEQPAECAGLAFEPGLVERLLTDFAPDQRFLLFLQSVLQDLWQRRREGFLTNRGYDESPDPVAEWAERAYGTLNPELKRCAQLVLPRLSTLCDNLSPLGRYCRREQLLVSAVGDAQLSALIGSLVDGGLIYSIADSAGRALLAPTFMIEQWPRAEAWLTEQADFYAWLTPFAARTAEYQRSQGSPAFLIRGELLAQAEKQPTAWLTVDEAVFIKASRERATRQRQQQVGALAVALIVVAAIGVAVLVNRMTRVRESESDASVLLQLSRNLAAQGDYVEATRGLDRAAVLYADAGRVPEVLAVQLERARNQWRQGKRPEAATQFDAVLARAAPMAGEADMATLRDPLVDVSRFFYTQGAGAMAVKGLELAWQMSGRRSRDAEDLTGHRLSLALAATHQYDLAQAAFREAMIGADENLRRDARTFYRQTLLDAPQTTQAVDNLARLLAEQRYVYDAVLLLDDGIKTAITTDPMIVPFLRGTRRDILKALPANVVTSGRSSLGQYVCEHNTHVYVMSVKPENVARARTDVRARYPLAEAGDQVGEWVPIIADFFLTCDQAKAMIEREAANGQQPFAGSWYRGCQPCAGLQ
jgi:hypothetical protein